jgi:hypothetical protein
MTYDELMAIIEANPYSEARWSHNYPHESGDMHVFTLKSDLDIRIVMFGSDDELYQEKWATQHPDSSAHCVDFDIYYGASLVESGFLVSVDGCRADLPQPDAGTTVVPRRRYAIARAVDHRGSLDEYMQRAGLTVEA